ncbi:MAG TPA: cobyrinate a,c-diamide synthase [Oscillospiraceae bacterium]|nr:cobyrinate a,c-diamide synthase [Oscillospiraceae bacterium]
MKTVPRIFITAPASGGGKTTVTCAVLGALCRRGLSPVACKCGPDYIDPMFHRKVTGIPAANLDLFFTEADTLRYLLAESAEGRGLAVLEGAMGFYDGIGSSGTASAYEVAKATETPAVLVLGGESCSLSAAAVCKGMAEFRPDSGIRGVILNHVGEAQYKRLREMIEKETGLAVYGYLPEMPEAALESRHLGLVTAGEIKDIQEKLASLAEQAERTIRVGELLELANSAPELEIKEPRLPDPVPGKPRIAVARDNAFCFYYAENLRLLEKLGAELVEFSPLADRCLPEGVSGLWLGGGYPELYAKELSENTAMLAAIKKAAHAGMPFLAECGGFLYLHDTLENAEGTSFPMASVFPGRAYPTGRLMRFGYVTLTARRDGLLGPRGTACPAHEFHYWESEAPGEEFTAQRPQSERNWACGYTDAHRYAGFPHLYLYGNPEVAAAFVRACAEWRQRE